MRLSLSQPRCLSRTPIWRGALHQPMHATGPAARECHVLHVFTHGRCISQVVIIVNEALIHGLVRRAPRYNDAERFHIIKTSDKGGGVNERYFWLSPPS